jgi:hypothetical protein
VNFSAPAPLPARWGLAGWNFISRTLKLAAGSLVFVRTEVFGFSGGFNESVYASEEIWLSVKLHKEARKRGKKFVIITDHPIKTSPRKFNKFSNLPAAKMAGNVSAGPLVDFFQKSVQKILV